MAKGVEFITFGDAQDNVAIAVAADAKAGKSPAELQIDTGRPLRSRGFTPL